MAILTTQEQKWVNTRLAEIQNSQIDYAALYNKYQQSAKTVYGNITVEVHESVAHNREAGYRVLLYKTVSNVLYGCGYGFGWDSVINTFDWIAIKTVPIR